MDGVNVQLRTENHDSFKQITTEDGAAFFSFHGGDVHEGHKFFINIETDHYDPVQITRHFQQSEKTQIIHVDLFPHQRVRLHVHLGNEGHYRPLPAFGAIVDWTSDDEGGIVGVTGNGIAELELSGKSDTSLNIEFQRLLIYEPLEKKSFSFSRISFELQNIFSIS